LKRDGIGVSRRRLSVHVSDLLEQPQRDLELRLGPRVLMPVQEIGAQAEATLRFTLRRSVASEQAQRAAMERAGALDLTFRLRKQSEVVQGSSAAERLSREARAALSGGEKQP
jgi:glycyl-tRNA synthetase beta subunit